MSHTAHSLLSLQVIATYFFVGVTMTQRYQSGATPVDALLRAQLDAFLLKPESRMVAEITSQLENLVGSGNHHLPRELFEAAVAQSPLAISITDLKANILYCNDSFTEVTGYSMDEISGRNESILSYKSTPKQVYQEMWQKLSAKEPWKGMLVNRRKSGERYVAELLITPVLDGEGNVSHYLGIHRDSTEMHNLEQRVVNQKALIESVVDAAPDAIALLDEQQKVILDNHAYKKLVGEMRSGEPALLLLRGLGAADPNFDSVLEQRLPFSDRVVECRLGSSETLRWFNCSGVWFNERSTEADDFFVGNDVPYLMLTVHEVTTLKRQQEEIKHNAMRALMAEEALNVSVRETLAAASYKLQEPLNLLNAAVAMMERRAGNGEQDSVLELLEQIRRQGNESLELLQQIMPVERGGYELLNLNEIIHQVLQMATPRLLAEGITLSWQPVSELPSMTGDARQLRVLFRHLLDNAIEAIIDAGASQREIGITTNEGDEWLQVTLCDSGDGIKVALQNKIFEPFYTTKGGRHTGMGLTMAQEAINAHAGTIEIDSGFGQGCCIKLRLPKTRHQRAE
jgi:nitrogen fixation negative regulator NifL